MSICTLVHADADDEFKIANVGLKLFISVLSADMDLQHKAKNEINVGILCVDKNVGSQIKVNMEHMRVKDLPINATVVVFSKLNSYNFYAIYIAQSVNIEEISNFGISNKIITYSPFEGDVSKGIATGMVITDKVLPSVNLQTLEKSDIRLKPFFLKIAKAF